MKLPWLHSLFARLMLILIVGIMIVLAVSFTLFVGERERLGRAALFESVAQEIATKVEVLDRLSTAARKLRARASKLTGGSYHLPMLAASR